MPNYTDAELDRDWQPSGRRPQSTLAQSFSAELMDIFRIENSVTDLDKEVTEKKQSITTQSSELEALEARLAEVRDMEARLQNFASSPKATRGPIPLFTSTANQSKPAGAQEPLTPSSSEDGDSEGRE